MSNLAQPPEAVARFVLDVGPGGEDGRGEVAEPYVGGDKRVAGGEEGLALRSGDFLVRGAYAHSSIEAVGLLVLRRCFGPVEEDVASGVLKVELRSREGPRSPAQ